MDDEKQRSGKKDSLLKEVVSFASLEIEAKAVYIPFKSEENLNSEQLNVLKLLQKEFGFNIQIQIPC